MTTIKDLVTSRVQATLLKVKAKLFTVSLHMGKLIYDVASTPRIKCIRRLPRVLIT